MNIEHDELRANLAALPNEELLRIARATLDEYRQEAIDTARTELLARGVDFSESPDVGTDGPSLPPVDRPSRYALPQSTAGAAPRFSRWWFWGCLTAAGLVLFVLFHNPRFSQGKPAIYQMTLAIDLIVLADVDRLLDWRHQPSYFKIKRGGWAVIAVGMTIWSLLCLVNVVNY